MCYPVLNQAGFENHLNVFHSNKQGLPKALSFGIAMFLNTTAVDEHFRTFNGHIQVNVTDLKRLKYQPGDFDSTWEMVIGSAGT